MKETSGSGRVQSLTQKVDRRKDVLLSFLIQMSFWWPDMTRGVLDSLPLIFELFLTFKSIYCIF